MKPYVLNMGVARSCIGLLAGKKQWYVFPPAARGVEALSHKFHSEEVLKSQPEAPILCLKAFLRDSYPVLKAFFGGFLSCSKGLF